MHRRTNCSYTCLSDLFADFFIPVLITSHYVSVIGIVFHSSGRLPWTNESCWGTMSPSCKFNNIVLPHHLCNHVTLLTCISCVILLLQNNLFNILGIQWGLFILIELHIIPVELWVIECVCVELLNEVTQAWISISYSGGCSRMCHRHFNMSKIHLMMLCSAK